MFFIFFCFFVFDCEFNTAYPLPAAGTISTFYAFYLLCVCKCVRVKVSEHL